jgi:hypothetical protein
MKTLVWGDEGSIRQIQLLKVTSAGHKGYGLRHLLSPVM